MVKWDTNPRETYLLFLAVRDKLGMLQQFPDPLHEQLKAEHAELLSLCQEALTAATEQPTKGAKSSSTK
jgi:hypothetical protein